MIYVRYDIVRDKEKRYGQVGLQINGQSVGGCLVYLVWGQAQGPQSSVMSIHCLQEASWGQLEDLQLPTLTGKTAVNTTHDLK